ncbi:hypothetical protein BDQ17DRAFT_1344338 [Cyathus striatus]|nr:hypothetical protein BDQ17DRAFT_1344338 [Cyathus striatus]
MGAASTDASPAPDEDWLIVKQEDWSSADYPAVSWRYLPPNTKHNNPSPSPLYFHHSTNSPTRSRRDTSTNKLVQFSGDGDDVSLNTSLPGVQAALDSLSIYESHSGFHYSPFPSLSPRERGENPDIGTAIPMHLVEQGRKLWEKNQDQEEEQDFDFSSWKEIWGSLERGGNLHRSTSTLSSIDLTEDSFSMPATPKAKSFDAVHISTSPSTDFFFSSPSPSRPLNASASSFVPTFTFAKPSPAKETEKDVFTGDFTFASLTTQPAPMVKIKKDEQGFFTEVHVEASNSSSSTSSSSSPSLPNSSTSSILLPPFLQEPARRKSKTRQIVDKLRSQSQSQSQSRRGSSQSTPAHTPLLDKDDSPLFFPEKKYASHSPSPSMDFVVRPRSSVSEGQACTRSGEDVRSGVSTPGWNSEMREKENGNNKDKEEGWIGFDDGKEKEKRKGLLHVLSRRRTDSLGSTVSAIHSPDSASSSDFTGSGRESTRSSISPVSTPPSSSCDDGWIEGSVVAPPAVKAATGRGKRRSPSSFSSSTSTSGTGSAAGTPPLFPSLALYPPSMHTHLPIPTPTPAPAQIPSPAPPSYQNQYFYPYNAQGYVQARAMHMPRPVHGHVMPVPLGMGMPMYGKVPGTT